MIVGTLMVPLSLSHGYAHLKMLTLSVGMRVRSADELIYKKVVPGEKTKLPFIGIVTVLLFIKILFRDKSLRMW